MHILLAPDSFKESLSAKQVAEALKKGFQEVLPDATFDLLPIGDGGEGTMETLAGVLDVTEYQTQVTGPFGQPVSMSYYQKDEMAFFEMASLVGLGSIPAEKRNPLELETRGIGELILQLVDQGVKTICVGIGGSATNDGGIGMAAGLVAFAGGQISSGIEKSLDLIDFDHKVQKADLVVVGEGRMDLQSLSGKAPVGVAKRTLEKIPVIAICGSLAEDLPAFPSHHIDAAFSIVPGPCEVADALAHSERNLISCARNIGNLLKIKAN